MRGQTCVCTGEAQFTGPHQVKGWRPALESDRHFHQSRRGPRSSNPDWTPVSYLTMKPYGTDGSAGALLVLWWRLVGLS